MSEEQGTPRVDAVAAWPPPAHWNTAPGAVPADFARTLERELSASQARAARLHSALDRCEVAFVDSIRGKPVRDMAEILGECAMALTPDSPDNWLKERLKGERERCAKVADRIAGNASDFAEKYRRGAGACAAAIRAMPEEG